MTFQAAWENTIPVSVLNECQEVKVEAFSDEEEILRDDEIRLGFYHFLRQVPGKNTCMAR